MNIYNPKIGEVDLPYIIGCDTEFNSLDSLSANVSVISITDPIKQVNYAFDVNSDIYSKEDIISLLDKVALCKIVLAHNSKADLGVIRSNYGVLLTNFWCTMMASQLIDNGFGYQIKKENLRGTEYANTSDKIYYTKNMVGNIPMMPSPHGLHGCIRRYLNINLKETIDKKRMQMSFVGLKKGTKISKEQLDYACSDTEMLFPLYEAELAWIKERQLEQQVRIENKLTPVIVKMEQKGCLIDTALQKENIKNWKKLLYETELKMDAFIQSLGEEHIAVRGGMYSNKRIKQELVQTALFDQCEKVILNENKGNINYASSDQIKDIFTRLGQRCPVDTEGKISFGEEPVKLYVTENKNALLAPLLKLLLDYREYAKLLSTYGSKLLRLIDKNGRMRTNYSQCWTDTGRLTSSAILKDRLGINLANIPQDDSVRHIFVADPGYSFVDCDQTGQELITVAGYSQEPVLLKAFKEGFDHHSFLASISYSIIFNRDIKIENKKKKIEIDGFKYDLKKLRDDHKSALFCKIYLGGPKRVFSILNEYLCNHVAPEKRMRTAERISIALDQALPKMKKHLLSKVDEVKKNGYAVTTMYGRRRYFDNPEKAFGDSANYNIQSTGSMSIKIALIKINEWLEKRSAELSIPEEELGWITMSIYDQNLICLNDKYLDFAPEIQQIMADSLTLFLKEGLQGSSDLKIQKYWSK